MTKEFKETVENIKNSAVYEKKQYWEERGLNQSDAEVVHILRTSTNDFLDKLSTIVNANTPKNLSLLLSGISLISSLGTIWIRRKKNF
ncbi:hypothetical protein H0I25_08560 [Cellulophaga sp. HaHa_2_95]|uniref:hypothetical protein n=1 Tax=Cellulophaga sp. HaHa_2_95 TaxID=2745558 RepID=UPI001C4FE077|nr:hypothetical protein [Cellulophaga sp. HaHa_2_95]QXP57815.1 hypothetical protein H0I25_08560 [Cellulophaga sp. HaHa_2_95]